MSERKPGYYGGFYDPNNKCFVDGDICLESDLREVEADRDKYKGQRDRIAETLRDCIIEIMNHFKEKYDDVSYEKIKRYYKKEIDFLCEFYGLSWEELKRKGEEMNKDFIKWLADYADGFSITENGWLREPDEDCYTNLENEEDLGNDLFVKITYPLLLQRAIEGINKDLDKFEIFQNPYCVWVRDERYGLTSIQNYYFEDIIHKDEPYILCDTPDQAKESALKYIMEKEIELQNKKA